MACYDRQVTLRFIYPQQFESLEIMLSTKVYEDIWTSDGAKIVERFKHYTGLQFQQDTIEVMVHEGQSMSGKDGVPMRLSVQNDSLVKKRNAIIHELAHRLLFGNGLYAPNENDPTDNDEIRVLLFQGDVIHDLYGPDDFEYWANTDPIKHTEEHLQDLQYVLSLPKQERIKTLQKLIASQA